MDKAGGNAERKFMFIQDAARELDISEAMAYRMVRKGDLEKVSSGTAGPDGEAMTVSVESVARVKRGLVSKLRKRLQVLESGKVH